MVSFETLKAGGVIVTPSPALLLYIIIRTCPSVICLERDFIVPDIAVGRVAVTVSTAAMVA